MQPNPPVGPSVQPGEVLAGKYRVERVIGEGGMGIVLAATNEALRQRVAIKLLRPGALANGEALGRFQREAHTAARLKSQHVARVLDIGALPDGRPYMVMEMLEGQDLGDVIARHHPLSVPVAVDYVLQACEAIAEAHAAGIVHRDLKPKNLFLTTTVDGRPLVKVLDFGISKVEAAAGDMQLTRTTEVIGSPSYMSPEQLRSARNVDARTDIWALGVILYELLSGQLPFHAQTITELVLVVATETERSLQAVRPDVPPALSEVVTRCLAKKPEDRIQTVVELAAHLEPFAHVGETSAAERIRGVALQSGRSLPSSAPSSPNVSGPTSSARIHVPGVHAGTSVAWGQTQAEPPRHAPSVPVPAPAAGASRGGAVAAIAIVAGVVLLGGGGAGAFVLSKRASSGAKTTAPAPPPPAESVPLPPGRKDLPPMESAGAPPPEAPPAAPPPSALPSTRTSPPAKPPAPPRPRGHGTASPDDLSNIGRR